PYRNPVSAAQLDKVNVAIAATGTGVTLTATPQGDDTDATGPYRKYSLVPDTASYDTQAIRYNTVTVQVDGANVGTEYHAAWSPNIILGVAWPDALYGDDAGSILANCPSAFILPRANTVLTLGPTAEIDETCGSDPVTGVAVRVKAAVNAQERITRVGAWITEPVQYQTWHHDGKINGVDRDSPDGFFARNGYWRTTTEPAPYGKGTADAFNEIGVGNLRLFLSREAPDVQIKSGIQIDRFTTDIGLLDTDTKGKSVGEKTITNTPFRTVTNAYGTVTEYPGERTNYFRVTGNKANAWFDRFTLTDIDFEVTTSRCYITHNVSENRPTYDRYTYYPAGKLMAVLQHLADDGVINGVESVLKPGRFVQGDRTYYITDAAKNSTFLIAGVNPVVITAPEKLAGRCGTQTQVFDTSYKDQNIVAIHWLLYKAFF
ncbi:hypothetical protein, partial [Salmonella enterica]|uniref:hypothetical protein n=1 Tax=Salmonella enterica TaxID=28901 RepID=UPI003731103C